MLARGKIVYEKPRYMTINTVSAEGCTAAWLQRHRLNCKQHCGCVTLASSNADASPTCCTPQSLHVQDLPCVAQFW